MKSNSLHFSAPAAGWSVLAKGQPLRTVPRGRIIYLQGEAGRRFYYLQKGRVRIFLISDEGSEKTVTEREPGSIFGEAAFLDGEPRTTCARTLTECQLAVIGQEELTALFQREPAFALQMLQTLAKTVRMLSQELDTISFLPADRRLAETLLALASPAGSVASSQEDLGALAGVTRITVNRVLHSFAQKGWVRLGYRSVQLLDRAALAAFSQSG
ncbi:MAG: Crp/Fnr family transcriptional regulator [Oscillospiraceae bacterium]|jgi:CRP/FNR family cyclic AMP-dependent transcriptional regulator|nr:Crp/Fnr family transcriptional regulator [Oscillospiraceae bacterium]MDD3260453.1 Crp/Fnr family transcriptional regulator [Oscillospiraceae bacterium]